MLSIICQAQKEKILHDSTHMWKLKKLTWKSRKRKWGGREEKRMFNKYKVTEGINFNVLLHSQVTIVNNILYFST
jgi:hypothetical protein